MNICAHEGIQMKFDSEQLMFCAFSEHLENIDNLVIELNKLLL